MAEQTLNKPVRNIVIFGDSYSTFEGYIPEGYLSYYSQAYDPRTDVDRVEQTWWHRLCKEMNLNLVLNNSWSGSTICYTGYEGDCSQTSSFIYRLKQLQAQDFFRKNDVDTILIFGGTNDHWAEAPLGKLQFASWQEKDLYAVQPAICCMIKRAQEALPDGNVVFILNSELKPEVGEAVREATCRYGTCCVSLRDIDKNDNHPTVLGMSQIAAQVQAFLQTAQKAY